MTDMRAPLFDTNALSLHRARATEDGLFLHDLAVDLVKERLEEIERAFQASAIIGWQAQRWAAGLGLNAASFDAKDALSLPDQPEFDLIIHALELHWMDDPVGQLIQMRRALKPDGLMISVLFGGRSLENLRHALVDAEVLAKGGLSPRFAPLAEIRDLGSLLQRAGFALPVADNHIQKVRYQSAINLMKDLREMGETNALTTRLRHITAPSIFENLIEKTSHEEFEETFELIFLTGWAPSDTQQQPLKPGSATHSLADALTDIAKKKRT